jgi:ATP-dependent helicase HrpB
MSVDLPVREVIPALRERLRTNPVVIVQAPPGAGKSTLVPIELMDEPWLSGKKIIMLEPRRLAAKAVAERMAQLRDDPIGNSIGYRIRFESKISGQTRIEVVTEGILTRKIQADSNLEDVGLIIFDEFHERSLQADLALALALQVQQILRSDLRILIMSATLDAATLSDRLGMAPVVTSEGRQFPVEVRYVSQESDKRIAEQTTLAIRKAVREQMGDVLVFLPGAGEIRQTQQNLEAEPVAAVVVPLYGDLPFKQQQEAILPRADGVRKIVLATSLAETSLTIEGIKVVVDAGFSRVPRFDPRSGLTRLDTIRVTRDSADQRAGRAGRLGPGVCYRLWTEATQRHLVPQRKPEILEADLAAFLLELYAWGNKDVNSLTWMTPPPAGAVSQATNLLRQLEAIDERGITTRGKAMVRFPTHPRIAHMLSLPGNNPAVKALACDVAAVLEERDPLGKEAGADLTLRIEALRRWRTGERVSADRSGLERIERLSANWRRFLGVDVVDNLPADEEVGRLLAAAYPERIAKQNGRQSLLYTLTGGQVVKLPPHDPLMHNAWLCAAQADAGRGEGKIFLASPLRVGDLTPYISVKESVAWDAEGGRVVGATEQRIGRLLVASTPLASVSDDQAAAVICGQVKERGLAMLGWGEPEAELQSRLLCLKSWREKEAWPEVRTEVLTENPESWLSPFLAGVRKESELRKLDKVAALKAMIPAGLQSHLDELAPARVEVPTGSMIRLRYSSSGESPVLEVRLQEMFGLLDTPVVNGGRTKVVLHLLSPGYKPVQVTSDLRSFWSNAYHEVRMELRRRYPRHSWPEDPFNATPVRGAKRRNQAS